MTREDWLLLAITRLRPAYKHVGLTLPDIIHVSIGFPSTLALSMNNRRIGECWPGSLSKDGNPNILIHPMIDDGIKALSTLVHELIHAAGIMNHKSEFKRPAEKLGLTGKMKQSVASPELEERLKLVLDRIGLYPHPGIKEDGRVIKKQTTRLIKAVCENEDCGAIIRLTQKVIDDPGLPTCACGGEFNLEI